MKPSSLIPLRNACAATARTPHIPTRAPQSASRNIGSSSWPEAWSRWRLHKSAWIERRRQRRPGREATFASRAPLEAQAFLDYCGDPYGQCSSACPRALRGSGALRKHVVQGGTRSRKAWMRSSADRRGRRWPSGRRPQACTWTSSDLALEPPEPGPCCAPLQAARRPRSQDMQQSCQPAVPSVANHSASLHCLVLMERA